MGGENFNIVKLSFIIAAFISFQGNTHGIMEARNSNLIFSICWQLLYGCLYKRFIFQKWNVGFRE